MTPHNPMNFHGRTFLVTGASSGIGRATAFLLSRLGARLIVTGRDEERLSATAAQLEGTGHLVERRDLNEVESIPAWIRTVSDKGGPLHGLAHCAGVHQLLPLRALASGKAEGVMRMNWLTAAALAQGFRQKQVHSEAASLVFVSSVTGLIGQPGLAAYASSKGALLALTRVLALELAAEGIRVNAVAPGHVRTEMTDRMSGVLTDDQMKAVEAKHPLGIGEPLDIAHAIAFLLADTGRWITGSTLVVDGGYTAQ